MRIGNISMGASSLIACYLERDTIDEFVYIHVADQHPDTMRFLEDCEKLLGRKITVLQSTRYKDVDDACRQHKYITGNGYTSCSDRLKRQVRKQWEYENDIDMVEYVWGFDRDEKSRCEKMDRAEPNHTHIFPLVEKDLNKAQVLGAVERFGIKLPWMYLNGYPNNNCIGCVRGGQGYWNKIREDFPDVFAARAKLERDIGASMLKETLEDGTIRRIFLDELDPERGRNKIIVPDCGLYCQMVL